MCVYVFGSASSSVGVLKAKKEKKNAVVCSIECSIVAGPCPSSLNLEFVRRGERFNDFLNTFFKRKCVCVEFLVCADENAVSR